MQKIMLLLLLAGCCLPLAGSEADWERGYRRQQLKAEERAAAFKENGQWTPAAIRRLAIVGLESGAVVPEQALAEIGVVVIEGNADSYDLVLIRKALLAEAQRREEHP